MKFAENDYDNSVDALYIRLADAPPEGVVEIEQGVHINTTADNRIVGIEILDASSRLADIATIYSYALHIDGVTPVAEDAPHHKFGA